MKRKNEKITRNNSLNLLKNETYIDILLLFT